MTPYGFLCPDGTSLSFGPVSLSILRELSTAKGTLTINQLADRVYNAAINTPRNELATIRVLICKLNGRLQSHGCRIVNTIGCGRGNNGQYILVTEGAKDEA